MSEKLKVAVIGVGYLGNYHSEKYAKHPSVELVAVVDVHEERARIVAERYQTAFYTDFKKIFGQVDAVSIVVPTDVHYDITKSCFEAGLDVLVEKPLTQKIWQAEKLLALAKSKKKILQVGHLERFNTVTVHANRFLTQPIFIECHRLHSFVTRGTEVDVVLDLMIHDLDIVLSFVPSPILKIDAMGASVLSSNIDIANVRLQFQNGCIANLTASRISMKPMRKMRIFQPDSYMSLDFQNSIVEIYRKVFDGVSNLSEIKGERLSLEKKDALAEEIQAFIKAVQYRTDPIVSAESALEALRLADRIVKHIRKTAKRYYHGLTKDLPAFQI